MLESNFEQICPKRLVKGLNELELERKHKEKEEKTLKSGGNVIRENSGRGENPTSKAFNVSRMETIFSL